MLLQAEGGSLLRRGFNVKWPFAGAIADKLKEDEVQRRPLGVAGNPRGYCENGEYLLIQTPGLSKPVADRECLVTDNLRRQRPERAEIVALIRFTSCTRYENRKAFIEGRVRSLIREGSMYDWDPNADQYAWHVDVLHVFNTPIPITTGQTAPWIRITFLNTERQVSVFRCSVIVQHTVI